jgi:hypothetical protein
LFEHIIHSWVGYELVKVLLKYGLSPSVRSDLNDWSHDLYELFAYFGEKKRDSEKRPTTQINILFDQTEHCSYFSKLGFGKKMRFEKMSNTIIPLVILTWLRQLQEHFFKLSDISSQADWSDLGRYFAQPQSKQVSKGVNHVHLSSATTQVVNRMKSFDDIKPKKKGKGTDKVVRSLCEWADRILCRNNEYVDDIVTQSIKEGETSIRKNYAMKKKDDFKRAVQGETKQEDEIEEFTPGTQKRKSQEQLMTVVGDFMMDEIKKLSKAKKKNIDSINSANRAVACLVQYVNTVEQKAFQSIEEMKEHMAEKAKTSKSTNAGESSSEDYSESDHSEDD